MCYPFKLVAVVLLACCVIYELASCSPKQQSEPYYRLYVDGSNEKPTYTLTDGERIVGTVTAEGIDSLVIKDNY